jgi:hypothetical protein
LYAPENPIASRTNTVNRIHAKRSTFGKKSLTGHLSRLF